MQTMTTGPSPKKTRLTDRQVELVRLMRVGTDNRAVFSSDAQIPDWAALKKVMVALGGSWKKGARGDKGSFVFADDVDAREVVRVAAETGEIFDPNAHDFFPTPDGLADALVAKLELTNSDRVLEPSAGNGALVRAVRRVAPNVQIVCMELLPANCRNLLAFGAGVDVRPRDFLHARAEDDELFTAVAMNPPFSKRADIAHVRHAFSFLKPGGRLAAIMSSGVAFRDDRLARDFRDLVAANHGAIEHNPPGSFKESGTSVNTVTVTLRKAG